MLQVEQPPPRAALERLLAEYAPLQPAPLCPEVLAHRASSLVAVWEAAERIAGFPLPAPFWAYAWPGGCALARVILDSPELVRGAAVLDFGGGGGVCSMAAAMAGAARATVNDIDAWALLTAQIAAEAQSLSIDTLHGDLCAEPDRADAYDVLLCSDLAYERSQTPRQRRVLERCARNGATVLVGDAGRAYFDESGLTLLAEYLVDVPPDLEGTEVRRARVYRMQA